MQYYLRDENDLRTKKGDVFDRDLAEISIDTDTIFMTFSDYKCYYKFHYDFDDKKFTLSSDDISNYMHFEYINSDKVNYFSTLIRDSHSNNKDRLASMVTKLYKLLVDLVKDLNKKLNI